MVIVREIKGWPHCFTLSGGETFRLQPLQEKRIKSSSVSDDLRRGVKMGYIVIISEKPNKGSRVSKHKYNGSDKLEVQ